MRRTGHSEHAQFESRSNCNRPPKEHVVARSSERLVRHRNGGHRPPDSPMGHARPIPGVRKQSRRLPDRQRPSIRNAGRIYPQSHMDGIQVTGPPAASQHLLCRPSGPYRPRPSGLVARWRRSICIRCQRSRARYHGDGPLAINGVGEVYALITDTDKSKAMASMWSLPPVHPSRVGSTCPALAFAAHDLEE